MPVGGLKIATAIIGTLLIAAPTAVVAQTDGASGPTGTWRVVKCPFPDKATIDGHPATNQLTPVCGQLTVPENYDKPMGRKVTIAAMIIQSKAKSKKADPVLFLSGGPGAYALPNWEYVIHEPLSVDIVGDRDWVIIDQRGTGRSGVLACPGPKPTDEELTECRDGFVKQGIDLSQYNSKRVAQDIEALRNALGIAQWNLHGISYGTRLAYTVARYFPKTVRSMVLDAPMLPESNPTLDDALGAEHALKRLGERCAQQPACNTRYPEVFDRFRAGLGFYRESPAHDEVFTLDNRVLMKFVKTHFQSDEIMPFDRRALETLEMMDAIGRHDLATVRRIVEAAEAETAPQPPPSTPSAAPKAPPPPDPPYLQQAFGQKWSVDCNEEKPFESLQEWEQAGRTDPIVDGDLKDMRYRFGICKLWPSGRADPIENQPVDYQGPQLIFSGELDPSLSGIVGETIARRYPKARNVVFANAWHGQIKTSDVYPSSPFNAYRMCAVHLMHAFTDNPSSRLDTSCARQRELRLVPKMS